MICTRTVVVLCAALSLAACGNQRDLRPVAGHHLPPTPYGRGAPPNANELMRPPVEAKPETSVDTRARSEERADDPFDLPPEN